MAPLAKWLKPPQNLLPILFLLTLASVSALGWFGWKLLEQERMVEAQRVQDRLEQAADRITAALRGRFAEIGARLNGDSPLKESLLLAASEAGLTVLPQDRLLYYPNRPTEPEASPDLFAEGELLEFVDSQPAKAIEWYARAANTGDPAMRAGALLRQARVLRRTGRLREAAAIYTRLAEIQGARVAGAPAELVGRHAVCELTPRREDAANLTQDLARGRWRLSRGQFEFYWAEAGRLAGREEAPPAEAVALTEAVSLVWRNPNSVVWAEGTPFFVMWRGPAERRVILVTPVAGILNPIFANEQTHCAAFDSEGKLLAGRKDAASRSAVRTAAESQLPWTLYVTGSAGRPLAGVLERQRFLLLGLAVIVVFLIAGTYFIARAIRREIEVSRLQSDFVSAVSHEFRSPLTSLRQLSEILAFGRVPNEERRQLYYETLVQETGRLQRLVEALLNFGKMEAGARQYRFETVDPAVLVERVVADFAPQIAASGRHIELHGSGACTIQADPEALSVALRNLVDNALKYSPDHPTVWVDWAMEDRRLAIRVRDQGAGIPDDEQKAIFGKFVRGSAAAAGNVKGSGVGLAMVRHIVAAHGGEIRVMSQPGQGSTFLLILPALETT